MSFSRRGHGDVFFACGTNEYTAKVTCVERLQKVCLLAPRPADDSHANGTKAARGSNFGSRLSRTPRSWSPAFLRPLRALDRWIASLEAGCARRLLAPDHGSSRELGVFTRAGDRGRTGDVQLGKLTPDDPETLSETSGSEVCRRLSVSATDTESD